MGAPRSNEETARVFGFGRLFRLTYEAVVGADIDTECIVLWNPAAEKLFGYSAEEAVGMNLDTLVAPELREAHHAGIRRFRETSVAVLVGNAPVEVPAVTKDGQPITIALSLTAIPTDDKRRYVAAVIRDVSAQKEAELKLRRANETMQDFVATASHELRTPLTAVIGFGEMLRERSIELADDASMEFSEVVVRAAAQANRLVDNLLTVSKIQAELIESWPEEWLLETILTEVVQAAPCAVEVDIAPGLSVFADRDHVRRILTNLVENAVKYGRSPIIISASATSAVVELCVRDYGVGVPEEFRDRLFDRFARADTARHRDGTGLGLSIVRGLARANGGDAFYEHLKDGSVFGVTLRTTPK